MARVGILGGTFNPPHVGHLVCAQEAWFQLELDKVLLMPVFAPPHKAVEADPGVEHRVALCEAAIAGDRRFEVSRLEVRRGGPSYTVDTLRALHARCPQDELTFIVGGDMAASLPTWREPEAVMRLARMAVAERERVRRPHVMESLARALPGCEQRLCFFDMPRIDISSSLLRARVAGGRPVRYLVGDAVAAYIAEHGLYRAPDAPLGRGARAEVV